MTKLPSKRLVPEVDSLQPREEGLDVENLRMNLLVRKRRKLPSKRSVPEVDSLKPREEDVDVEDEPFGKEEEKAALREVSH